MSKKTNIVVLCDGTWLSPNSRSNVFALYERLRGNQEEKRGPCTPSVSSIDEINQHSNYAPYPPSGALVCDDYYYEAGVNGPIANLLCAFDLDDKIKNAYRHIVKRYNHHYNSKHEKAPIWLFGFSRGAYTVRCVAGMIRNCGILKYDDDELINRAYQLYRSKNPNTIPEGRESENFRNSFSHPFDDNNYAVKFLGLWDTVGAYGFPTFSMGKGWEYLKLHDLNVSKQVHHAYQVLSIHENFSFYEPCQIFRKDKKGNSKDKLEANSNSKPEAKLEEIWFPGNHSVIGGGSSSLDKCISEKSLDWMIGKIKSVGDLELEKGKDDNSKFSLSKIFESLYQKTFFWLDYLKQLFPRDRIIPLFRDDKGMLTFDLLYDAGKWNSEKFKNITKMDYKKRDSLIKYYNVLENILINEIVGNVKHDDDRKQIIIDNRKEIKEIYKQKKDSGDEKGKEIREKIHDLFDKVGEDKIDNIISFSALTISKFDIEKIKRKIDQQNLLKL